MENNKHKKVMVKTVIWYVVGSLFWFISFGFLAATKDLQIKIILSFLTLTAGLFIGLVMKEVFIKRPWLVVFIPVLHLIVGMLG